MLSLWQFSYPKFTYLGNEINVLSKTMLDMPKNLTRLTGHHNDVMSALFPQTYPQLPIQPYE
jgi:hypothetical protein